MSKVSITKAAKLAGISRTTFYEKYIKKGKISISQDSKGQKEVDVSEILRVFGTLQDDTKKSAEPNTKIEQVLQSEQVSILQERLKGAEALLREREQELQEYREREKHYRTLLLGVDKTKVKKRFWWFGKKD